MRRARARAPRDRRSASWYLIGVTHYVVAVQSMGRAALERLAFALAAEMPEHSFVLREVGVEGVPLLVPILSDGPAHAEAPSPPRAPPSDAERSDVTARVERIIALVRSMRF